MKNMLMRETQNTIESNLVNTRLLRKVSMSTTAIGALEKKVVEQDRALLAKSNKEKKRATKKQNDKNEQIQLPENQNAEQKYIVWK